MGQIVSSSEPGPGLIRPLWSRTIPNQPRGLALARERGWLLLWDEKHWLYLLNSSGERQAQAQIKGELVAACASDDGSAYAAVGSKGEVYWLAPDLMPRWERTLPSRAVAVALDPLGSYLAASDSSGNLHVIDHIGRVVFQVECPRALHHLAFVPTAARLLGASDYGLVACFDAHGQWIWRDGLVSHVGSLTLSGDGKRIILACFTDGLLSYTSTGQKQESQAVAWPCRLASVSFDGSLVLVAWLTKQLLLLDADGRNLCTYPLDKAIAALAIAALGDWAAVALSDGTIHGLEVRRPAP